MSGITYALRYLRDGYTFADAFRPNQSGLQRRFTVDAAALPAHTDDDIIQTASESAPAGYWLQSVEAIGGDSHIRQVFGKSVPGTPAAGPAGTAACRDSAPSGEGERS